MSKQELLPCPFCGARTVLRDGEAWDEGFSVECENQNTCCAYMGCSSTAADAVAAWNRRAVAPMLAAQEENYKGRLVSVDVSKGDEPENRIFARIYGQQDGDLLAIEESRNFAAQPVAQTDSWRHAANEWADAACNVLQGLRNIRDGISTPDEAIAYLEQNIAHCREVDAKAKHVYPVVQTGVPEGYALVPIEATQKMVNAGVNIAVADADQTYQDLFREGWKAMLAAAPTNLGTQIDEL